MSWNWNLPLDEYCPTSRGEGGGDQKRSVIQYLFLVTSSWSLEGSSPCQRLMVHPTFPGFQEVVLVVNREFLGG